MADIMEVDETATKENREVKTQANPATAALSAKSNKKDALPWIEKYRPKTLDDLVAHENIVSTIQKLVNAGRLPHLLLYGPPGTGKTSTILAVARQMFGKNTKSMVLELNASDARGIDTVRNEIQNFAGTRKLFSSGIKLVILDEADNMTRDAQMALRRVIEKYTKNTRFCLICNYVSKIIPALQSRCTRFRFAPLKTEQVIQRTQEIIGAEKLNVSEDGLKAVLRLGRGDMRKILNILQSAALAYDVIDSKSVHACVGKPTEEDIRKCFDALMNKSFNDARKDLVQIQANGGLAIEDMLSGVFNLVVKTNMPKDMKTFLIKQMAETEYRLAFATNEKIQLASVIATFYLARQQLETVMKASK